MEGGSEDCSGYVSGGGFGWCLCSCGRVFGEDYGDVGVVE